MFRKVLTDIEVRVDLPSRRYFNNRNEWSVKQVEAEAREIIDFLKDHRSQDGYSAYVHKTYESVCDFCGYEEERDDEGIPICCGRAAEEAEAEKALKGD